MSKWTTYYPNLLSKIPNLAGVYAIYYADELVFIGQSERLRHCITHHKLFQKNIRETGKIKVKLCPKLGEWCMAEFRLIRRLKPRLNKNKVNAPGKKEIASPEVKEVMEFWFASGWSYNKISKSLNKQGVRDLKNRLWSPVSVYSVLRTFVVEAVI